MVVNSEPASNITDINSVAAQNAASPILVTLAGMVIEVKVLALLKACVPMIL